MANYYRKILQGYKGITPRGLVDPETQNYEALLDQELNRMHATVATSAAAGGPGGRGHGQQQLRPLQGLETAFEIIQRSYRAVAVPAVPGRGP